MPNSRGELIKSQLISRGKGFEGYCLSIVFCIGIVMDPFSEVDVAALCTDRDFQGQMTMAKNVIIMVVCLFKFIAINYQELFFFP